jgi:diguanylate cyclase (GGDEF)-like protein/PAS domain S-box-containing protein
MRTPPDRKQRSTTSSPATAEMALENEVANATLDAIGEAVLRTDVAGRISYLNRTAEEMTGWRREEALGRPMADVLRIAESVEGAENAALEDRAATAAADRLNCVLVRRDGFKYGIERKVTPTHSRSGTLTGAVVAFRDVSAARAKSLELSHLAQHDALTDLPNRVLFSDRLTQAIALAERQAKQLAVMFIDLDYFKKINDSLGHEVGDKMLVSVADRLTACVRRSDTVGRLSGDEFAVLLAQVEHPEDAAYSAQKILRALSAPHVIDNKSLGINVSIGVSTYPIDAQDAEGLLNRADNAMYEAKEHGRNNYQFFRHEMHEQLLERQVLEADLRYALGRNEFVLHYQPKLNLQTGQITGVEALIRWRHPQRGMIYPGHFIAIAEECGLIIPIGQWVLLEACKQAKAWRDSGLGVIPVSVNVSAAEFGGKDYLSGVRTVLIATGVEPRHLELELTESVLMRDAEAAVETLIKLKAMGVQLAIDDFGAGYSSFAYLRRFPSDALKLDHSFVQEIRVDSVEASILSAMINLGRSLKQRVIAEGVETRAQFKFLLLHGCNEGQGYYFSPPVVAAQAQRLFENGIKAG